MTYGAALDIGTTTISGSLLDLENKIVRARFSCLSGQLSYGHDIISRIGYALRKTNGPERLQRSMASSINFVLHNLTRNAAAEPDSIERILAVGNAVMHHLLFSLPVDSFARPPYTLHKRDAVEVKAGELGIEGFPKARFRMLPNIAGFIGSDAIAVMLATGLYKSEGYVLAMDIGTNGEIILGCREGILVSSTAAGPAFESWHIKCGMRAVKGAIESAEDKDGEIRLNVIGDIEPKGISASGLIDLICILLRRGEIDKTGRLKSEGFVVYNGPNKIFLNQSDIREVQLAKAAFSVGTKYLRARKNTDITKVYITGTFGNYLDRDNARLIGLIPEDIPPERIEFLNQGALLGAEKVLVEGSLEADINAILARTEHVLLAQEKDFQAEFAAAMHF